MTSRELLLLLAAVITGIILNACNGEEAKPGTEPALAPASTPKTTEVKPKPGVSGVIISGDYPAFAIHDCIEHSDTIVIGEVTDILPAKWGNNKAGPMPEIIYQDVIITTERYLYGQPKTDLIAVRVMGGEVGDKYMAAFDMPVFTVGERSLLCLHYPPEAIVQEAPEGIDPHSYYQVTAGIPGKFDFLDGTLTDYQGQATDVATFEENIAIIKGGESGDF